MALVEMRRLVAALPKNVETDVMESLGFLSCVEVEACSAQLLERYSWLCAPVAETDDYDAMLDDLADAKLIVNKYNPVKSGLFAQKIEISKSVLLDLSAARRAVECARRILSYQAEYDAQTERAASAEREIAELEPLAGFNLPLNFAGTSKCRAALGIVRPSVSAESVNELFEQQDVPAYAEEIFADERKRYISVIYLEKKKSEALSALKSVGFEELTFNIGVTASERMGELRSICESAAEQQKQLVASIKLEAASRDELLTAIDTISNARQRERLAKQLATTAHTAVFWGWVPLEKVDEVAAMLDGFGCAYEFVEPAEGDTPPTATKNNRFVSPFESVTEMYGTAAYGTKVDPNPIMSPFYFVFFGFIMADVGYGLLMTLGCWLVLKLAKPSGNMKKMLTMFMYCGVSTFFCGFLTGGFFGDALTAFTGAFFGKTISMPVLWFNPMQEPLKMLVLSIGLGFAQLVAGLGASALRQIREKDYLGAFVDTGSWYLVFIGAGLLALGLSWGMYVAGAGVAVMLFLGGRNKKGFGKVTGGLGKVYDVIGYASDLLSYSRIMALGLSGAVVAQVFNQIGAMAGGHWWGVFLFLIVFAIGHAFNLATGVLSAYVHTSRLQYIEFYGKFFIDGGREFRPFCTSGKYTQIKEEK